MTTLINELYAEKAKYWIDEDASYETYLENEAKQEGLNKAIEIVKKFVADNADLVDAQPVILIEKLTGDV